MAKHTRRKTADRYEIVTIRTGYWKPGEDYLKHMVEAVRDRINDGDIVAISEKAISTAMGNILDESLVHPTRFARFLAKYWVRWGWGYILGPICRLRWETIQHLRTYPIEEGSAHKQVALERAGILQVFLPFSEGGIDASNMPYSLVSLPLKNAQRASKEIRKRLESELRKKVRVMIVDTDKTYSIRSFHFTPRPKPIKGIHSFGGFLTYIAGRLFRLRQRATPIAFSDSKTHVETALEVAEMVNRARGFGSGRSVWEMAEKFGVPVTGVTWRMLERVRHTPIVIVRKIERRGMRAKDFSVHKAIEGHSLRFSAA